MATTSKTLALSLSFGAAATIVAAFACSTTGDVAPGGDAGTSSGGPVVPDGGMVLDDGAVVDSDGEVVPQVDSAKPSKVNLTTEQVFVLGQPREFLLAVPKTYDANRKYPLIIALHGDGGDGPGFAFLIDFQAVNGDDAIVAYPTGTADLFTPYDQNPDQLLVDATINAVKAMLSIDDAKVWGFGYSKGGFLANQIACRRPGILKAMANHASGAPQDPDCPGVVGLPTLATEGEFDTGIGGFYSSTYWASVNGCMSTRSAAMPAGCETYNGCPADKPVVFCRAAGVGHYPPWNQAAAVSWAWFKTL